MKKTILLFSACLALISCSKKDTKPSSDDNNTHKITDGVTISGSAYSTIVIGNKRWTVDNYNGPGGVNPNGASSTDYHYGKLYTQAEAQAVPLPTGWRLPADTDMKKLVASATSVITPPVSSRAVALELRSSSGWKDLQSTNNFGFDAYPAGYYTASRAYTSTGFLDYGYSAHFWCNNTIPNTPQTTKTEKISTLEVESIGGVPYLGYESYIDVDSGSVNYLKNAKFSVRFVKDN